MHLKLIIMASNHTIQNEHLTVAIKAKGAELASIKSKTTGIEYIWQADPTFWGRHSPILFPIIGEASDGYILIDGKNYALSRHGFLREMVFGVVHQESDRIVFATQANENTLKIYPYAFEFQTIYELKGSQLSVSYRFVNIDQGTIYFSVGGHPAFNCPLLPGEKRSDYALVFNENETAYTQLLNDKGLRNGERRLVLANENTIQITDELFDNDALIFHNLSSDRVSLVNTKTEKTILSFDFKGFPYLGIWSKNRQSPYVCIEPWFGIADTTGPKQPFQEKEGVLPLEAGEQFECTHRIQIH